MSRGCFFQRRSLFRSCSRKYHPSFFFRKFWTSFEYERAQRTRARDRLVSWWPKINFLRHRRRRLWMGSYLRKKTSGRIILRFKSCVFKYIIISMNFINLFNTKFINFLGKCRKRHSIYLSCYGPEWKILCYVSWWCPSRNSWRSNSTYCE